MRVVAHIAETQRASADVARQLVARGSVENRGVEPVVDVALIGGQRRLGGVA